MRLSPVRRRWFVHDSAGRLLNALCAAKAGLQSEDLRACRWRSIQPSLRPSHFAFGRNTSSTVRRHRGRAPGSCGTLAYQTGRRRAGHHLDARRSGTGLSECGLAILLARSRSACASSATQARRQIARWAHRANALLGPTRASGPVQCLGHSGTACVLRFSSTNGMRRSTANASTSPFMLELTEQQWAALCASDERNFVATVRDDIVADNPKLGGDSTLCGPSRHGIRRREAHEVLARQGARRVSVSRGRGTGVLRQPSIAAWLAKPGPPVEERFEDLLAVARKKFMDKKQENQ